MPIAFPPKLNTFVWPSTQVDTEGNVILYNCNVTFAEDMFPNGVYEETFRRNWNSKLCSHPVCECGSEIAAGSHHYTCNDVGQMASCIALNPVLDNNNNMAIKVIV